MVVALALLLLGTGPLADPAPAQTATAGLRLVSQPAWTAAGAPLTLRVAIDGNRPLDGLELGLRVHAAVGSRSQFDRTLDGALLGSTVAVLADVAVATLPAEAEGALTLSLPLPALGPGVYPVVVTLRAGSAAVDRLVTYLVRTEDRVDVPLRVAWVQPVGAPPATRPDGSLQLAADDAGGVAAALTALAAHPEVPVTVDLTPETAEAVAALRPTLAAELARLGATPTTRPLVGAPYVDVDASALVAGGRAVDLVSQRARGGRVLADVAGGSGDARLWSADAPLSPDAVGALLAMGVTTVVVPEAGLVPLDPGATGRLTLSRPFALADREGRVVDAVIADRGLGAHFAGDDPVLAAQRLVADLAVLYRDLPRSVRGVVVRPPADWQPTTALLGPAFTALGTGSIVQGVRLDDLVREVAPLETDGRPVVRDTFPGPAGEGVLDRETTSQLTAAWAQLDAARSMTGQADDFADIERQLLLAEADGLTTVARRRHVAAATSAVTDFRDGVHLVRGRTFRLTAREGTIPITIVNESDLPVTVSLELSSDKLEFLDGEGPDPSRREFTEVVLEPEQRLVLKVRVLARASAAFPLRAVLRTPSGSVELARVQFTVVSTAVSGVGIVLSVGSGLVLVWWWIRHWRGRRAERVPRDRDGPAGGGPDENGPDLGGSDPRAAGRGDTGSNVRAR